MLLTRKNLLAGMVFIGLALFFGLTAYFDLRIGTARRMGPGFVPLLLAGGLGLVGIGILIEGLRDAGEPIADIPWRGFALITAAIILFGMTARPLGVLMPLTATIFMACFASRRTTVVGATITTVILVALTLGIFKYALGRPMPLFGPLLQF